MAVIHLIQLFHNLLLYEASQDWLRQNATHIKDEVRHVRRVLE